MPARAPDSKTCLNESCKGDVAGWITLWRKRAAARGAALQTAGSKGLNTITPGLKEHNSYLLVGPIKYTDSTYFGLFGSKSTPKERTPRKAHQRGISHINILLHDPGKLHESYRADAPLRRIT